MLRLSRGAAAFLRGQDLRVSGVRPACDAPPLCTHCAGPQGLRGLARLMSVSSSAIVDSMIGCTVYVSEGKDTRLISQLEDVSKDNEQVALVNKFVDEPYHRTSFTLCSPSIHELSVVASSIAKAAIARLDLTVHQATHPRLGVVDHISCHPLGVSASLGEAASLAHAIGSCVGGGPHPAPTFLYGAADGGGRRLADLRRAFGYFDGAAGGQWSCAIRGSEALRADFGPTDVDERVGIVAVGATPWVVNFNVLLNSTDMTLGRSISKAVSQRGGGLPAVESMALRHTGGLIEVACNLLDYKISGPDAVLKRVTELAATEGVEVKQWYEIGKPVDVMIQMAAETLRL